MSDSADELERARAAFERRAWDEAHARLAAVDRRGRLEGQDLQRLAESAYLTGRAEAAEDAWARAHQTHLDRGEVQPAVRCAFWLGLFLLTERGADARGGGWIARVHRLVEEQAPHDGAARGYRLLAAALGELNVGDPHVAYTRFAEASAVGERSGDADLTTLGRLGQGQSSIRQGEATLGVMLLDEVMVMIDSGRVSSIAVGFAYCAVIVACQQLVDVRRAQQWTEALNRWCATQPELVPFRGQCLVHRSELAQLRGDLAEAVTDADHACAWLADPPVPAGGMAYYQRAELHRLLGQHDAAEQAYERAAACGHDPHPGLALLWLDRGRTEAAAAAIRRVVAGMPEAYPRVVDELHHPRSRAELLSAYVEILLAAGDLASARTAGTELATIAESVGTPFLVAMARRARGAVLLAEERPGPALDVLTDARSRWLELGAPYEAARTRVLIAGALRTLGDDDTAAIEQDAARRVFERIGAASDLARLDGSSSAAAEGAAGLTAREVEVLRLVAAGHTNREIAGRLVISDKTVARHLHNVFTKLDLPNRSAATAYAYQHGLV